MRPPLLVLRPEPGATATTLRAREAGWRAITAPIFTLAACPWSPPDPAAFDAVMMTSANAARLGGPDLALFRHLPIYAVGQATAEAARTSGFQNIRIGASDGAALLALAGREGVRCLLHLAGYDLRPLPPSPIAIERRTVYRAAPAGTLPEAAIEAIGAGAIALLHSPRAGAMFAALFDAAGLSRAETAIAAISPAALAGAGTGWHAAFAAVSPDDHALLAAAARVCEQDAR